MTEKKQTAPDERKLAPEEQKQLDEIRAKRAQLAAKRAEREADAAAKRLVPNEALELANDEGIEAAEAQHGPSFVYPDEAGEDDCGVKKIAVIRTALGVVIVRRPAHSAFRRFQNAPKSTDKEATDLVETCLVYPERAKFHELIGEQPAVLATIANAACWLAGWRSREVTGKA